MTRPWLLALLLPQLLAAQVPDSIRRTVWHVDTSWTQDRFYTRIRVDTLRLPPPLPTPALLGVGFGAWNYPLDSLGTGAYNSTVLAAVPASLGANLAKARAAHGHLVLAFLRTRTRAVVGRDTVLSVAETRRYLTEWPDITPYLLDGTVVGLNVSDDITGKAIWGPGAPYYGRIDSLALAALERWPTAVTYVRARPDQLPYKWRWLAGAIAQYNGVIRDPPPAVYAAQQQLAADSLGLCLALGLNTLSGGDGSSGIYGTYTDTTVRRYQMSAPEVLRNWIAFLPHTTIALHWEWSPIFAMSSMQPAQLALVRAFDGRADVRLAMTALATIAAATPRRSCHAR